MLKRESRQFLFVSAPAEFRRGRPLFAESFDAPSIDELIDLFGLVRDLGVPFAAMDDFNPQCLCQVIERLVLGMLRDALCLRASEFLVGEGSGGNVEKPLLGKVAYQTRISSVFEHRRGAPFGPAGYLPPEIHVPPIQRSFRGMRIARGSVGIPEFHR